VPNTSSDGDNCRPRINEGEAENDSLTMKMTFDNVAGRKPYNIRHSTQFSNVNGILQGLIKTKQHSFVDR
jgi:hypothetical protein